MPDFSETVKEHIGNMTPEELAATESRRLSRDAAEPLVLEARWDKPGQSTSSDAPIVQRVSVQVGPGDPIASGGGILIFSGEAGFRENIILTPSVHRLIAGGPDPAATGIGLEGRFVIRAGGTDTDSVSAGRSALISIMERERPVETARALRLVALEPHETNAAALAGLVKLFATRWDIDIIHSAVEEVIAKVPSRILHLIAGKDHVSLSVCKEELSVGAGGFFQSPLAATIVRPPDQPLPAAIVILGDPESYRQRDVPFLQNTFGTGAVRRLVLDVVKLKDVIAAQEPEARELAIQLLARLVARAAELNLAPRPRAPLPPIVTRRREPGILPAMERRGVEVAAVVAEPDPGVELEPAAGTFDAREGVSETAAITGLDAGSSDEPEDGPDEEKIEAVAAAAEEEPAEA